MPNQSDCELDLLAFGALRHDGRAPKNRTLHKVARQTNDRDHQPVRHSQATTYTSILILSFGSCWLAFR